MRRNKQPFQIPQGQGLPMLGQNQQPQQPSPEAVKAAIAQQIGQITQRIYERAAGDSLATLREGREHYQDLAQRAHVAAKAYFEGLGIVDFGEDSE